MLWKSVCVVFMTLSVSSTPIRLPTAFDTETLKNYLHSNLETLPEQLSERLSNLKDYSADAMLKLKEKFETENWDELVQEVSKLAEGPFGKQAADKLAKLYQSANKMLDLSEWDDFLNYFTYNSTLARNLLNFLENFKLQK